MPAQTGGRLLAMVVLLLMSSYDGSVHNERDASKREACGNENYSEFFTHASSASISTQTSNAMAAPTATGTYPIGLSPIITARLSRSVRIAHQRLGSRK